MRTTKEDALAAVRTLLSWIGEDPGREGLRSTPDRVVRALTEATSGYEGPLVDELLRTPEGGGHRDPVILTGIRVVSTCEHHLAPIVGTATIGYLPGKAGRIVGLSKLARLVDLYALRLQTQERLTKQIAEALMDSSLEPHGVGVMIRATHHCIAYRGASQSEATTSTRALLGDFVADPLRGEFLAEAGAR